METRHIKLNYEEALSGKKQILSMQLNLLQTAKKVRNYRILRKKEFILKTNLKTKSKELGTKIGQFLTSMPKDGEEEETPKRAKRKEKEVKQSISKELEDIQRKLSKLG